MKKKCTHCNTPLMKRLTRGTLLGILAGLLCFWGFTMSSEMPTEMVAFQTWSWGNLMMWSTIANTMLLGILVVFAGFMTIHPIFGFKFPVFARGLKMGALASLPMALGAAMGGGAIGRQSFWYILIAGMIIGMVIDLIITKIAGDGKVLLK